MDMERVRQLIEVAKRRAHSAMSTASDFTQRGAALLEIDQSLTQALAVIEDGERAARKKCPDSFFDCVVDVGSADRAMTMANNRRGPRSFVTTGREQRQGQEQADGQ